MDRVEYELKCLEMVRQSLLPRKPAFFPDEPRSDCCIAPLERVGDELYACSVCGHLCHDDSPF